MCTLLRGDRASGAWPPLGTGYVSASLAARPTRAQGADHDEVVMKEGWQALQDGCKRPS